MAILFFRISYSDFVKTFTHLETVHLDSDTSRDEPSLHHKQTWQMRLYQGAWQKGVSAGGCRNNPGNVKTRFINMYVNDDVFIKWNSLM